MTFENYCLLSSSSFAFTLHRHFCVHKFALANQIHQLTPPCCHPPIEPEAQRKRATATFHSSSSTGFSKGAYFESSIIPDTHTHAHRHQQPPAGNSISSSSISLRSQQREWFSQSVFLQHQWRTSLIATARNPPPPEQETPQSTRTHTHTRTSGEKPHTNV